ncbi:MAG: hypothetical protein K2W82_14050 [Candidatus Obscuribacterales bacterium]|nr:hypothetical protein [Candidatus Obscuribacterales bacterium]
MSASQSYPPLDVLKTLNSFRIQLKISRHADAFNLEDLKEKISGVLAKSNFAAPDDPQKNVDAILACELSIMPTATYANGEPVSFAFACLLRVFCPVAGRPHTELYCVWDHLGIGASDSLRLNKMAGELVVGCIALLTERLAESRK